MRDCGALRVQSPTPSSKKCCAYSSRLSCPFKYSPRFFSSSVHLRIPLDIIDRLLRERAGGPCAVHLCVSLEILLSTCCTTAISPVRQHLSLSPSLAVLRALRVSLYMYAYEVKEGGYGITGADWRVAGSRAPSPIVNGVMYENVEKERSGLSDGAKQKPVFLSSNQTKRQFSTQNPTSILTRSLPAALHRMTRTHLTHSMQLRAQASVLH